MRKRKPPQRFRSGILAGFLDVASFTQIDGYAVLRHAGIDPRWLGDHAGWLPATSVVQALESGAKLSGREDFGILLADCQSLAILGPVAVVLEHQPTVRDMLKAAIEFQLAISDALTISLVEERGIAVASFDFRTRPTSSQLANFAVATAVSIFDVAAAGQWKPLTVHFRHAPPRQADAFAQHFRCPVLFNDDFDGFACDSSELDARTQAADPSLANYAHHLLFVSPEMDSGESFRSRIADAIYLIAQHGTPTLAHVAGILGTSGRSVQRNLAKEQTSFGVVLNDVRREITTRNLAHSTKPISEIAYSAGFSSPSAFSRWCRSEFKCSPSDLKQMRHR